jgi:peptidyl-tRNA hydrolase, PTH1 family
MQLWVGLGNPGAHYALHRHNVGFMAVDVIAAAHAFGPESKKFKGLIREGRIDGHRVLILKPQTFMNESGQSVRAAMDFYKIDIAAVTAFYDELDLAPFKIKVKRGGGAAGHNGIRSMIAHVGEDFRRVRLGIGHPGHKDRVTPYVLGNFAKAETEPLSDMLGAVAAEARWLAAGDDARFLTDLALRLQT